MHAAFFCKGTTTTINLMTNRNCSEPPVNGLPPEITSHAAYREAEAFKREIRLRGGVDYNWTWDYAKEIFEKLTKVYKELDDKANDIIKYLGGGAGLLTLGTLASITPRNVWIAIATLPSLCFAIISIRTAMEARRPRATYFPPDVKVAFDYANAYPDAKGEFLGQWNLACVAMRLTINKKSELVTRATGYFYNAILFLILPLAVAIFLQFFGPPDAPSWMPVLRD